MNKKAQMMSGIKMVSIVFALILIVVGLIPLLNYMGAISFNLPKIPDIILHIIIIVGGVLLIIDAFRMPF